MGESTNGENIVFVYDKESHWENNDCRIVSDYEKTLQLSRSSQKPLFTADEHYLEGSGCSALHKRLRTTNTYSTMLCYVIWIFD